MRRVMSMGRLARLESTVASRAAVAATGEEQRLRAEARAIAAQTLADPLAFELGKRLAIHMTKHGPAGEAACRWAKDDPECRQIGREWRERLALVEKGGA